MEIRVVLGTIEKMYDYEAIVNPTNSHLALGTGGVATALKRHGEEALAIAMDMAREQLVGKELPRGSCVITGAGNLANGSILHVALIDSQAVPVVPVEPSVVRACVSSAIRTADEERLTSIAFPILGAGASGRMDPVNAVQVMLEEMKASSPTHVQRLAIVVPERVRFEQLARKFPSLIYEQDAVRFVPPPPVPSSRPRKRAAPSVAAPAPSRSFAEVLATSAGRPEHRYGPGCAAPAVGDRLAHPIFGVGLISAIRGDKWDVLFAVGLKTLKQPQPQPQA